MPTESVRAFARRGATDRRECWHQTTLVAGISVTGAVVTIARAVQSEAFETALLAFAMVE